MYSYIKGTIIKLGDNEMVLDNNGIGYEIICPFSMSCKAGHIGDTATIYIYQSVREDDISLYGFISPEQKDMFLLLITVSGIGPKVAHSICSQVEPDDLAVSVMAGDVKALTGIKGLGKKGAERIILELKDKVAKADIASKNTSSDGDIPQGGSFSDAVEALMVLGYKQQDAAAAVRSVFDNDSDLQTVIRAALRSLAR